MNSSNAIRKGLILGVVQIFLVASLGAKLLYDRNTRPRVWVQAQAYDPNLPIRGRYLSESLLVPAEGFRKPPERSPDGGSSLMPNVTPSVMPFLYDRARLEIQRGQLIAVPSNDNRGEWVTLRTNSDSTVTATLREPVLFFIPDTAKLPTLKGQQIWVEVTVPAHGPPRPIRLGIKENGVITAVALD